MSKVHAKKIRRLLRSSLIVVAVLPGPAALAGNADKISPEEASQQLDSADKDIMAMRVDLETVGRAYSAPIPLRAGAGRVEQRLAEGEYYFLLGEGSANYVRQTQADAADGQRVRFDSFLVDGLGNYVRASILLFDVVDNPANKSHPRYDDCLYFLAESLRRIGNYSGARQYFEELLSRAQGERLKDTVIALLEIAGATGRYDRVEDYLTRLRAAGSISRPEVDYVQAKMLFKMSNHDPQKLQRAYELFRNIISGSKVSAQASYYAGVVAVDLGRLPDAVPLFQEAINRAGKAADGATIRNLGQLALGRVYLELGDIPHALAAYEEVASSSPDFSRMLFEVAWAHVRSAEQTNDAAAKQKALQMALRTTELLMASAPDSKLFPEARILEGNLEIRLGAEAEAYDTFQAIIDRYGGARTKLAELIVNNPEPRQFFDQLVAADLRSVQPTAFIPPVAVDWASKVPEMKRAVGVIEDVRQSDALAKESEELYRTMDQALKGEQRYNIFKGLSEPRAKAFGIENHLVVVNRRLVNLERKMVYAGLSPQEQAQLDTAFARREGLEGEVQTLPTNAEQVEASQQQIMSDYKAVDRRVFQMQMQLNSMRGQLVAVESWIGQNRDRLSKNELDLLSSRMTTEKGEIAGLEKTIAELTSDIRTESAIESGDAGRAYAQRVRDDYSNVIGEEIELLHGFRSKLPSDLQVLATRIDGQRSVLNGISTDLKRLQGVLDEQVNAKIAELRGELDQEHGRLGQYEGEETVVKGETDGMLGPIAVDTLKSVNNQFQELVLKADVGIIDVAWARKQASTDKVSSLVREQQDRIRELDAEFADVLEGN